MAGEALKAMDPSAGSSCDHPNFVRMYCGGVVDACNAHEKDHASFTLIHLIPLMMAAHWATLHSLTEVTAHEMERAQLENELARLDQECDGLWFCDVDSKGYRGHALCERSCRPTLGSTIRPFGQRCKQVKKWPDPP